METFLLAAVLVVLVGIAAELYVLIRQIDARPTPQRRETEGATIQVNVGTLPGVQTSVSPAVLPPEVVPAPAPGAPTPEPPLEAEEPPQPVRPRAPVSHPRNTTPNGLGVVKCPQCGSENSAFRKECFRCEAKL